MWYKYNGVKISIRHEIIMVYKIKVNLLRLKICANILFFVETLIIKVNWIVMEDNLCYVMLIAIAVLIINSKIVELWMNGIHINHGLNFFTDAGYVYAY